MSDRNDQSRSQMGDLHISDFEHLSEDEIRELLDVDDEMDGFLDENPDALPDDTDDDGALDEIAPDEKPDIAATLDALREQEDAPVNATVAYGLSDLSSSELAQIKSVWVDLPATRRRQVMRWLVEIAETNFEMDYREIAFVGLNDDDPGVREAAIDVLFEDQSVTLMNKLIEMAQWDEIREVRAAATSALGRFILAGELGDVPEIRVLPAQDVAVDLLTNDTEDVEVRRRALEAISNCSHAIVPDAIREAYGSEDQRMKVSAVFAMGRSCDERWSEIVLREIDSDDPELRYEAARAVGQLELVEAVPRLIVLADGDDPDIKAAAIWSLGEIGGHDAERTLNRLAQVALDADDPVLMEMIEDALANAALVSGDMPDFSHFAN